MQDPDFLRRQREEQAERARRGQPPAPPHGWPVDTPWGGGGSTNFTNIAMEAMSHIPIPETKKDNVNIDDNMDNLKDKMNNMEQLIKAQQISIPDEVLHVLILETLFFSDILNMAIGKVMHSEVISGGRVSRCKNTTNRRNIKTKTNRRNIKTKTKKQNKRNIKRTKKLN